MIQMSVATRGGPVAEERTFQIQLEGLIQLLAQNLYAEPDVFLREMIQNAHDSIKRRAELAREHREADPPPAHIQVVVDRAKQEIHVLDNGSGLTDEEIDGYLSTIGRSGTDELRQRIVEADRSRTIELIGQFGIGLLSAFIVADRVSVITKAADHEALWWESRGGRNYTVQPGHRDQVGTTVTLHVTPDHSRYLDRARLELIIRTYADFIGMPVFLNDDTEPTNAVTAPWHRAYPSEQAQYTAYHDFWERRFTNENSLHVLAVDEAVQWPDVSQPGGKGNGRIRGVLAITDRHTPDVNARGTVDVYVNRMFINAANRDVLPPWAKFLQGVVECNELTPNAARDNVVRNAALLAVQSTLGELIVRELTELSQLSRRRFIEIMRWHSYHILAMAVQPEYEQFFRAVADLMPLESDQGPITVADYLESAPTRSDGSHFIYYITERGSANQFFLLASARSIRVFNCHEVFAERFLKRYAEIWPQRVFLSRLDVAGSRAIFQPLAEGDAERFADLETAYSYVFPDRRYVARVSRFRPSELPAVLTETRDSKNRREMAQMVDDVVMPQFLRDIVQGFLAEESEPLTLHLNADNPTIQKLAGRSTLRDEVSRQALVSLYNNALMLLAPTLPVESVQAMFTQHNQVIELMLLLAEERAQFERELNAMKLDEQHAGVESSERDPYVSCFVAMPFSDPRAAEIYDTVRAVLEDRPYFWRVVRADDNIEMPGLWPNLKAKLVRAHFYIAILTGASNPNVMIEIGRMEALERPLLILRDAAAPELPADLQGLLYEELKATGNQLHSEVVEALGRQQALQALKGRDRFLSETILKRDASLNEQASKQISRRYPAWQGFLDADSATVASQVGIPRPLVEAIKETLKSLHSADT
jgi:molecular chaperone HtpG